MLFKEERCDVGERNTITTIGFRRAAVNKSKLLVGELRGNRVHRILHQESYADDHICLLCHCGEVFGVFTVTDHLRLNDHVTKTILLLCLFVACMGKLVKATVI